MFFKRLKFYSAAPRKITLNVLKTFVRTVISRVYTETNSSTENNEPLFVIQCIMIVFHTKRHCFSRRVRLSINTANRCKNNQ